MHKITLNQKKTGAMLSYFGLAAQTIATILLTPFFIRKLGDKEYGLFELVGSIVSYLSILGLGFAASYLRFYSRYKEKGDDESISTLNGLFVFMFSLMSTVCIILGVVLTLNIKAVFGSGIDDSNYTKAQILMVILVFNMALTFPRSIFTCNNAAHEKFIFQNTLNVLNIVLVPILRILFVLGGYESIGLALGSLVVSLIEIIIDSLYSFRVLKLKFSFRKIDRKLYREIFAYTFFIFINQIYDLLGGSKVDVYIIGRVINTENVTVYSVGDKFVKIFYTICVPLTSVFVPQIHRLAASTKDTKELSEIFNKVGKLQFVIQFFVLTGFLLFGKEFISFWVGEGYEKAYLSALIIMASDTIALSQHVGMEIQRAMNMHKSRSVLLLLMNIGNIIVTIPLTMLLGIVGAAIGTAIAEVIGTIIILNIYYSKHMKLEIGQFWKSVLRIIMVSLPLIFVMFLVKRIIPEINICTIIILGIIYTIAFGLIVWLFILDSKEKMKIIPFLRGRK